MRTPAARVLRTGTFRDAWLVVGGAVISRGQGSTGDGCSVRDLGCIVSVRGICNRQHTETRTLLARLSLFFLIFSSDRPSIEDTPAICDTLVENHRERMLVPTKRKSRARRIIWSRGRNERRRKDVRTAGSRKFIDGGRALLFLSFSPTSSHLYSLPCLSLSFSLSLSLFFSLSRYLAPPSPRTLARSVSASVLSSTAVGRIALRRVQRAAPPGHPVAERALPV